MRRVPGPTTGVEVPTGIGATATAEIEVVVLAGAGSAGISPAPASPYLVAGRLGASNLAAGLTVSGGVLVS